MALKGRLYGTHPKYHYWVGLTAAWMNVRTIGYCIQTRQWRTGAMALDVLISDLVADGRGLWWRWAEWPRIPRGPDLRKTPPWELIDLRDVTNPPKNERTG